jgi:2-polyprenyl-6-methoxyphenol hydroxylase-like FAD-dependent oxidoreductase
MADSPSRRVLVVGGGITGSTLALALAQRDVHVILVELRRELGGVGHGITLQGNALKAFHSVGILDELAEHGCAFDRLRMFRADGVQIMEMPAPPMGGPGLPPTMGALRARLADILARRVTEAGVDVRTGTTVTAIDDRGHEVVATLSDGTTETVDLLVGADGIRSKVRSMIGIVEQPRPVRNATVRMTRAGRLLKIGRADFDRLLKAELLREITPEDAQRHLQQNKAALIDCRYEEEWELWRLKNARLIPLQEIRERARGLEKSRAYIVYCRTGRRSRAAAFLMRQAGLDAHSLKGGIAAWPYELEGVAS